MVRRPCAGGRKPWSSELARARSEGVKLLLLGADGQLGSELGTALAELGELRTSTEAELDFTDGARLRAFVRDALGSWEADVVVNAAAYTDVDGAERHESQAMAVNADAVRVLGQEAARARRPLVHYSTDYVFDGRKGSAYLEEDAASPINAYGRTKLAGEQLLSELGAPALVLRTAWIYSLGRKSFVSTMLRLAREPRRLRVVDDQRGCPTFAGDLARATACIVARWAEPAERDRAVREGPRLVHLAATGSCTRYELAAAIIELDPHQHEHRHQGLEPVPSSCFPLPAERPANTALDCSRARALLGVALPAWREGLAAVLGSLAE